MSKYKSDVLNIRVLSFLEAYERQECLWNTSLDSYKNKGDRDKAYLEIIKELNVPSLTIHDIKLKVKGIRTTYAKELRILNAHKRLCKPYKPKLFWFNRANTFLKNVCVSGRKKELYPKDDPEMTEITACKDFTVEYGKEVYSTEEIIGENESIEDEQTQIVDEDDYKNYMQVEKEDDSQEYHMKQQIPSVEQSYTQLPKSNPKITNTFDSTSLAYKEDEFDLFCRSVAGQLRAIPDSYSRSMAKLKIQQILFEAETGHYKNSPCITIPIVQQINSV